jgi:acetylornithine deacetylase/succinyl-diaminopimelate desuccinylase-like protein
MRTASLPRLLAALTLAASVASPAAAQRAPGVHDHGLHDQGLHDQALDLLKASVAFRTVIPGDQVRPYADYLKGVLVRAGFAPGDVEVRPTPGTAVLIARYRGADPARKPIVIIDHMDVVEARREDWTRDPFTPVTEKGYLFGRGAVDDKFDIAVVVSVLGELKRQGWTPRRDVILALSGDEETRQQTARTFPQLFANAELVLNGDAGGGELAEDGQPVGYGIQAAEKTYADFTVAVTNPGGHSSRPGKTNAIYELAADLTRLAAYRFPVMSSEITRAAFRAAAPGARGPTGEALRRYMADPADAAAIETLSQDPDYVGQLRTTCVATMIAGGHATNALPQRVSANVNCRIFPGVSSEEVRRTLLAVMADPAASVVRVDDGAIDSPASPLRPDVMAAVTKAVHARFPGLPVVPVMSASATDGMFFRAAGVPTYGVSGLFIKASDDFAHGLDERVPLDAIDGALAHWESLLKDLAR